MQSEVFRFGNPIVDDWEGRVNAWPLDEGLIDYVDPSYGTESDENPYYVANVIANPTLNVGGEDARRLEDHARAAPRTLQEVDDVEANVATGYHAIEFLLWGQDLNGTGPGAGNRPWTDYAPGDACTDGNCDRRRAYLKRRPISWSPISSGWPATGTPGGAARKAVMADPPQAGLTAS